MIKKLTYGMAAASLAALFSSTANANLIIDDFSTLLSVGIGGYTINSASPNPVFDLSTGAGILGGDRELELARTNSVGFVSATVESGRFSHANGGGATGTSLLRWDGTGGTSGLDMGLGSVNLAASGDAFHLTVISADLTGSSMEVRLYTSSTNFSIASVDIPRVPLDFPSPFEFYLSLAAIQAGVGGSIGGTGVDLTNVNAIEWFANGIALDFDATIDIVEIVPEPASLTLLGAGIMGLGYFGKRRKA